MGEEHFFSPHSGWGSLAFGRVVVLLCFRNRRARVERFPDVGANSVQAGFRPLLLAIHRVQGNAEAVRNRLPRQVLLAHQAHHLGHLARKAVAKLNELPLVFPEIPPIIGLCLGDEQTLKQFREETEPEFPTVLIDPIVFFSLIGDAPPRFTYISEAAEISHWDEELPADDVLLQHFQKSGG